MTEQLFLKQFSQLPENLKQELLDFLEFLMFKYQNKQADKKGKMLLEKKNNQKEFPDMLSGDGKHLPIVKYKRSGMPVPLVFGGGKHLVKFMADDFTAPLKDFEDYM